MQRLEEKLQATETLQPKARLARVVCVVCAACAAMDASASFAAGMRRDLGEASGGSRRTKKGGGSFRRELLFFGERKTCAKGKR